ncbi:response regulator [Corallococcus sp. bb12-1]|uniref:DUF4388 domain-containing protein n=1 Tax=Corallococcus sp. bb12-1 TaxID=2996784 RepID=UPI00226E8036|nr:DUF4388 domain-containing protein [Corallococcus sp. bb12-1]MCY1041336.1 response regulator [Corallococcus sp. bb12-1]
MKTLLLAESHPPTLEHLTGLLSQAGYTVRAVNDAVMALEHFSADNPDVVVLGVDLPRVEGQHVVHLIRGHSQGGRVPIVAIDKGHLGRARGVGSVLDLKVNAYIPDPLKPGELVPRLESLVKAAQAQVLTGLSATLSRPAVAAGDLKAWPLPALLHSLYRLRRDGVLVVAHRDLCRRVYFLRGGPVNFDASAKQDALPRFLRERKVLTEAQEPAVVESLASGLRIGAALADVGAEAVGEELLSLLRDFTRDRLGRVLAMREGRFAFYAGDEFSSEVAVVDQPALAPLLEAARQRMPLRVVAAALRAHLNEYPVRSADFGRDLQAMALDTEDIKLAMQVNGRIVLKDLLAHGRAELRAAYTLMWFLRLTGGVTFSPVPVASGTDVLSTAAPDVIAPRKRKTLPAETAASLREEAVRIITRSYFGGLGLHIAADKEAVERAYHETAMRFHPDTYAEFDISDLKDLLDQVQEKLSASYRVLSVDEKRRAYLQYFFSRQEVVGRATAINVDAEIALRRGESALKRGDYRTAIQGFQEAVALNEHEPEYYSYLAWALYRGSVGSLMQRALAARKVLKRALTLDPYLERAQIIAAIIEIDLDDAPLARKKLMKVLELNPYSVLARAALQKVVK